MADQTTPTSTAISPIQSTQQSTGYISINATAQLPLKLTPENYFTWRAQFLSLAFGYDLIKYIDGSFPCPGPTLASSSETVSTPNPTYLHWKHQDQLIFHSIIASSSERVAPLIACSITSKQAWDKLARLYSNPSCSRVFSLRERLARPRRGSQSVADYLNSLRSTADELSLIDVPITDDDIVVHIANGVGAEFKEIIAGVRTRETAISFDELYDKLVDFEATLKRADPMSISPVTANATQQQYNKHGANHKQGNRGSPMPHQNGQFNNGQFSSQPHNASNYQNFINNNA